MLPDATAMAAAVTWLGGGGVVAFPTDTVPGLGCLAASVPGVQSIFALKARTVDKPLILLMDSLSEVERLTGELTPRQRWLLTRVWPGPFTAVLPLTGTWPDGVGRNGAAGFRIPDHPVARALIRAAGGPLATTSANRSDEPPLRRAEEATGIWGQRVVVLPGSAVGTSPSTVADLTSWPPRILRAGGFPSDRLHQLVCEAEAQP